MILNSVPWFPVPHTGQAMTRRQCECLTVLHMGHGIGASPLTEYVFLGTRVPPNFRVAPSK